MSAAPLYEFAYLVQVDGDVDNDEKQVPQRQAGDEDVRSVSHAFVLVDDPEQRGVADDAQHEDGAGDHGVDVFECGRDLRPSVAVRIRPSSATPSRRTRLGEVGTTFIHSSSCCAQGDGSRVPLADLCRRRFALFHRSAAAQHEQQGQEQQVPEAAPAHDRCLRREERRRLYEKGGIKPQDTRSASVGKAPGCGARRLPGAANPSCPKHVRPGLSGRAKRFADHRLCALPGRDGRLWANKRRVPGKAIPPPLL